MQTMPDTEEMQARFSDMEATYKDLLAAANATSVNLNILLKATQRELQKAQAESLKLKKELDAAKDADQPTSVETLPTANANGHDANHAIN